MRPTPQAADCRSPGAQEHLTVLSRRCLPEARALQEPLGLGPQCWACFSLEGALWFEGNKPSLGPCGASSLVRRSASSLGQILIESVLCAGPCTGQQGEGSPRPRPLSSSFHWLALPSFYTLFLNAATPRAAQAHQPALRAEGKGPWSQHWGWSQEGKQGSAMAHACRPPQSGAVAALGP